MTPPRLTLISDATLNRDGGGINQTLANLFALYPMDRFLLHAPREAIQKHPPSEPFAARCISFRSEPVTAPANRVGAYLEPFISALNAEILSHSPMSTEVRRFDPELVLLCGNKIETFLTGMRIIEDLNKPFAIYLMDDWIGLEHKFWLSGSAKYILHRLLQGALAWISVSEGLIEAISRRSGITPKRSHIVHNPACLAGPYRAPGLHPELRIVYAGSIWPMHADAVLLVAQAADVLRQEGVPVTFTLYTGAQFHQAYEKEWQSLGVKYDGLLPYDTLRERLVEADLLVVATSFLEEQRALARGSLQTKLTDYMAAGRAILACGPRRCVCNMFVEHWNCGVVCDTSDLSAATALLRRCALDKTALAAAGRRGFDEACSRFSQETMTHELYGFLEGLIRS